MSCVCKSAGGAAHAVHGAVLFAASNLHCAEQEKVLSFMGLLMSFGKVLLSLMSSNAFFQNNEL